MQVRAGENEKKYHWFIHPGKTPAGTIAGTGFVNCLLTTASFLRFPDQSFHDVTPGRTEINTMGEQSA